MKRAPFVLAGTIAGLAGVLAFHSRPPAATALPASGSPGAGSGTAAGQPAASGSPGAAGRGTSAAKAATGAGARSATGAVEKYGYGELEAGVTAAGHRITGVSVPLLRTADPYSQQLAVRVIPQLRAEVLSGQTAHINGVSGATYTSQAYAASVQAALDKLHLK